MDLGIKRDIIKKQLGWYLSDMERPDVAKY